MAFWEKGLTGEEVKALSSPESQQPYLTVLTKSISISEELDFAVTLNGNIPFTFELPAWIEAVDVQPFLGKHTYLLRALPIEGFGTRNGVIRVLAEGMEPLEIAVEQTRLDGGTEDAVEWLEDDKSNNRKHTDAPGMQTAVYDLGGRRITASKGRLHRGLYVSEGNKMLVK